MDVEVIAHGQELSGEYLDKLFCSIRDQVPVGQWVRIQNQVLQATAGIKHLIDMDMYGCDMDIVFNNEFTHFKKIVHAKPCKSWVEPFVIDKTASSRQNAMREAELEADKRAVIKARKVAEREEHEEKRKKRRR